MTTSAVPLAEPKAQLPSDFSFTIPGEPVAKGSRTTGRRKNGSVYTRESSARVDPWMRRAAQVLWVQATAAKATFTGPVDVTLVFEHERPAKPTRPYPSRSDIDKACRAALDALVSSGVLSDDRHVVRLAASKRYAPSGSAPCVRGTITAVRVDTDAYVR